MNGAPPRRLRRLGARLPYALRHGLAKLPDPEPTPAQLGDLRERLAPLLPRESRSPGPPNRVPRSRSPRAPKVGQLRGMIAAALFPLAVAAGVRLVGEYRLWVHAPAPPIHVEPATEVAPPGHRKAPAPIRADEPSFPDDIETAPEPTPPPLEPTRATRRPPIEARPVPTAAETSAPEAPPPSHSHSGELEMLGRAVASLATDPAKAFALTNDIERTYPDGVMRQEREVIAIKALVKMGEVDRARVRLDQFRATYPTSIHSAQLQKLVP